MRDEPLVLVTGGAGFIGSHTCVELLGHGYRVVVVDDFSHGTPEALERVEKIAGQQLAAVHDTDIRDRNALAAVFDRHPVDAVIHFAARKAVGESVAIPVEYYDTNVGGTTTLLAVMQEHGVRRLVYSSSCSIYGDAQSVPIAEDAPARPTNPYAASKHLCESILRDVCARRPEYAVLALRYFNPIGAHPGGLLGEDPRGEPDNLVPYIAQVAAGERPLLHVFGDDYPTPDGTGIRDYIHVMDVAEAHRIALVRLSAPDGPGYHALNIGTGTGSSVLDLIGAFREASGRPIPYDITDRRPGDVAALVADPRAAARAWGWHTVRDLAEMCHDAWNFQQHNPRGYAG